MTHNKTNHLVALLFMLFSLSSCNNKKELNIIYYKKYASVDSWGDSIFLSSVKNLQVFGDKLYFMDQYLSQIFEINKDLSLNQIIGNKGDGPKDFIFLEAMNVVDSFIYVFDAGHASFFCYNLKGNYIDKHKLADYQMFPLFHFIIDDSCLVVATQNKKGTFVNWNRISGDGYFWGKRTEFDHEKKNMVRNYRHVLKYKDKYISVSDNIPVIEFYDKKRKEQIEVFDYSDIDFIQNSLLKNASNQDPRSYLIIAKDMCIDNDNLYVLLNGRNNNQVYINKVLKIKLNSIATRDKIIQLPGELYTSICVSNDTIYAFNKDKARIELLIKE